ncbi:hypothetical protein [Eggerthella lenta]|uniref:hypothetical protein n=1 Tax=Eggerthella lenta TaxID=84112 RepID=UPI001FCC65F7|nr:hypothetical protein [Eggerthella lenta]BDF41393.1 hypothetical protein CE91St33_14550 [Eggerthella lenta]
MAKRYTNSLILVSFLAMSISSSVLAGCTGTNLSLNSDEHISETAASASTVDSTKQLLVNRIIEEMENADIEVRSKYDRAADSGNHDDAELLEAQRTFGELAKLLPEALSADEADTGRIDDLSRKLESIVARQD